MSSRDPDHIVALRRRPAEDANWPRHNRPLQFCVKTFKWIPVLFITAVVLWSYYAYVVQLCFMTVETILERVILVVLFHIFFLLFLWAYFQTIFTQISVVPKKFRIPLADLEKLSKATSEEQQKQILEVVAQDLPVTNRTHTGSFRFCDRCQVIKPDRTHHCSVCGVCVLKMDHHCPWINNCVNFSNYKFFVLFLGYALLFCIYVALSSLRYFLRFWKGDLDGGVGRFHIVFLFFVAGMFAISLVSLFGYHVYLVLKNRTTLEAFRPPIFRGIGSDKNGFNLGRYNNFQEVFGDDKRLWFLPVSTSLGNGVQFRTKYEQLHQEQNRLATTTNGNANSTLEVGVAGGRPRDDAMPPPTVVNMDGMVDEKTPDHGAIHIPMEETRARRSSTSVSLNMRDDEEQEGRTIDEAIRHPTMSQ